MSSSDMEGSIENRCFLALSLIAAVKELRYDKHGCVPQVHTAKSYPGGLWTEKETIMVSLRLNVDDILIVAIRVFSPKEYAATNMQDIAYEDKINESNLMGAITKEVFPALYDLSTETTKYIRGLKRRMIERAISKGELKAYWDTDQLISFIFVQSYGLMGIAYEPVYCMGNEPLHQQVDTILTLLWHSGIFTESARSPEMAATPFLFPKTK